MSLDITSPRVAVITCKVLEEEIDRFAAGNTRIIRIAKLDYALHIEPDKLRTTVQATIDQVETETNADVIALGYGLCSRGTEGVKTKRCRLVIARAHDCITHLLGSKERYAAYVKEHPGTYWYSVGWNKHHTPPGKERHDQYRQEYVTKYGEDNADFLLETEQAWFKSYNNAAFVHLGVGDIDRQLAYTRQCAQWLGWQCDCQAGDPTLLKVLLTGPWDDGRFLVMNPGQTFRMVPDERVIELVP